MFYFYTVFNSLIYLYVAESCKKVGFQVVCDSISTIQYNTISG